ncbi:MAG TPA: TonB-dependent receptor [bacterium]|nr:TonB-dependent receptor [bacterium]HPQ18984.1 TonB-dependent receptor [bacterium]
MFTNLQYKNSNLIVKYSDRKKVIPQSYFGGIFNSKNNYVKDKRYFIEARTTKKVRENDSIKLRAYYDYYRYLDLIEYNSWYLTAGYPFFHDLGENNFYGSEIQYENNFFENDNIIIGFEFQKHKTEQASWEHTFKGYSGDVDLADGSGTTTVQYPLDKQDFNIWNLYLQNYYYPTKNVDLLLGLRYTKNSLYKGELSPRAGIIYRVTEKLTSKLLYSTGFRAPTIYERFFDDFTSLTGNDKLGPETIKNYEFIVEYMLPFNIRKVISLYYSEVKDIIKQELINYPNYNYAGDNTAAQFQNTSKIKIKGIEISLERNTFEKLNGFFNVCYNKTEDKITNTELVNSPKWIGSFGLDYKLSKILTIAMENNYVGKRKDTNGTELKSYLISDIIFTANNLIDKFDLTFKVNNLFDKEERHIVSDDYSPITSISQPGRNLYLKIDYKF